MNKIKAFMATCLFVPAVALADNTVNLRGSLCSGTDLDASGINNSGNCTTDNTAGGSVQSIVTTIVNILSWIVGVVSVVMIIIGGFRYIISGGEQKSVTDAKNTILYAIVGLIIVALAQIIVHFVVKTVSG